MWALELENQGCFSGHLYQARESFKLTWEGETSWLGDLGDATLSLE